MPDNREGVVPGRVRPAPIERHEMPAVFGPSPLPSVSHVERVRSDSVRFVTDPDAAADLVPHWFQLPQRPAVSVTSFRYRGIDYLGGGGYNVVSVTIDVVHPDVDGAPRRAPFGLVMWESAGMPVVAGREYMGHAKLVAEVPDPDDDGSTVRFGCLEGGVELVRASVTGRTPLPGEQLERLRRDMSDLWTFGWKYIQGPAGSIDADYPTAALTRHVYERASSGFGALEFCDAAATAAPVSGRIAAALRALPVVELRPAFSWSGSMHIDRAATRRLASRDRAAASTSTEGS